jgi:Kdo2-lipid IVA lauroyltransferase/acyltransferase
LPQKSKLSIRSNILLNRFFVVILKGISYLPFFILYRISDVLYVLMRYIAGYRKKVVFENLRKAFPAKPEKEIGIIANKFYRHLCDIVVETLKMHSISEKSFAERIKFKGVEATDKYYEKGSSIILFGMHYNNWEWSAFGQKFSKLQLLMIYDPVRDNPVFEKYILDMRGRFGGLSIPIHKSARIAIEFSQKKVPVALWLAADQRPNFVTKFWTTFLNQETCFYSGPEKIAKKTNQPIFFHLTRKIKRGYYEVTFYPLIDRPAELTENEILLTYVRMMEEFINDKPEYYLWSHRRWIQKRPEDFPLQ